MPAAVNRKGESVEIVEEVEEVAVRCELYKSAFILAIMMQLKLESKVRAFAVRPTAWGPTPDARTERRAARDNMMSPVVQLSLRRKKTPMGDGIVVE